MITPQLLQSLGNAKGLTPQQQFVLQVGLSPLTRMGGMGGMGGMNSGGFGPQNLGGRFLSGLAQKNSLNPNPLMGLNNPWVGMIATLATLILLDIQMQKKAMGKNNPNALTQSPQSPQNNTHPNSSTSQPKKATSPSPSKKSIKPMFPTL